jgi:hypothetical protein
MRSNDHWPLCAVAVIFASAFATLALSFWPYMIPFVITIDEAAAPQSSLAFMFWAGVVVFPLMLLYTAISYSVFGGKVGLRGNGEARQSAVFSSSQHIASTDQEACPQQGPWANIPPTKSIDCCQWRSHNSRSWHVRDMPGRSDDVRCSG